MLRKLAHIFIPHPETHKKSPFLSWHYLVIYILLFTLLRAGIDLINVFKPGVLGVDSNISSSQVIEETNKERSQLGLALLKENKALSEAATLKARNMFSENYWAHYSPSGRDPWSFITGAGYKFSYAGENLARNFSNTNDMVRAWMASPTHRENILNSKYQDVGIGVAEGVLQGQKTTIVVQMFGRPYTTTVAKPQIDLGGKKVSLEADQLKEQPISLVAGAEKSIPKPLVDPYLVVKSAGIALMAFIFLLLILDFIILKRRGVFRISSHHIAHLSFLTLAGTSLFLTKVGEIL